MTHDPEMCSNQMLAVIAWSQPDTLRLRQRSPQAWRWDCEPQRPSCSPEPWSGHSAQLQRPPQPRSPGQHLLSVMSSSSFLDNISGTVLSHLCYKVSQWFSGNRLVTHQYTCEATFCSVFLTALTYTRHSFSVSFDNQDSINETGRLA